MSKLSFLPDWLGNTFDLLQSGWLGILCISVLGPILEEMLFRGAITKVLLRKYNPVKAIILSALIFGPGTPVAKAACQILEILMDEE